MQLVFKIFRATFLLFFVSTAGAQTKPVTRPLRTLIVGGGPTVENNQYAIESNARYVEKLTATGKSQRVLFADGKRASRSIPTLEPAANLREATVLAWILERDWPKSKSVLRSPTLKRLDGPATNANILRDTRNLAQGVQSGERGLIYFTGHGSQNTRMLWMPDSENTNYNSWWNNNLSVKALAPALQSWPQDVPLTLVMVQCHSGGFANLIFKDGDPQNEIWPRDFCGFFASLGELMSAGCTSEMDEQNYHDFTTHFFAALSGTSRDGRPISGADYDKNGAVSGLEALAYTHLHDHSIDVPVCTSDIYLRSLWKDENNDWMQTPFSTILQKSAPWQKAVLLGLSRDLKLSGESRVSNAYQAYQSLGPRIRRATRSGESFEGDAIISRPDVSTHFHALEAELLRRFPQLKSNDPRAYAAARRKAIAFLKTRPVPVAKLYAAEVEFERSTENAETHQAKRMRFVRMARTVVLQERLKTQGTAVQKAVFTRLRTSESRNFLK